MIPTFCEGGDVGCEFGADLPATRLLQLFGVLGEVGDFASDPIFDPCNRGDIGRKLECSVGEVSGDFGFSLMSCQSGLMGGKGSIFAAV